MSDPSFKPFPAQGEKETHLFDYLRVVQRRWRIACAVFVLVVVMTAIRTGMETPIYEATAVLRVSFKPDTSQEVLEKRKERYFSIDSELQVLRSYKVAERAAQLLQLGWHPVESGAQAVPVIRRLQVSGAPPEFLTLQVSNPPGFTLTAPSVGVLAEGQGGLPFATERATGLIELQSVAAGFSVQLQQLSRDQAVSMVNAGVRAYPVGDQVSMIGLTVQRQDPKTARDVANAIALAYQELAKEQKVSEAGAILALIDRQIAELGAKLQASEQDLQEFRIRTGLKRLTPEGASMVDATVALEKERTSLVLKKQRIQEFLRNPGFGRYESTVVELLPGVPELMTLLLELQTLRSNLLREYTESYPAVAEVDDKIRLLKLEIASSAELAVKNLDQEISYLDTQLADSNLRLQNVPQEELELARLSRASAVTAQLYSYLLQRQQEERIIQASITGNVEIINQAQLPGAPVKPNKQKNLGLGVLIGLLLGVGLTFLLEYLDQTVKNEEDVQDRLGLTILGAIPRIDEAVNTENRQLVTHLEPHSLASEAFLALRTNLHFMLTNQQHKSVMLTSCLPDEGKSTVAVNLAATMAQTGAKTLLVGCDLRRPSLFEALGQDDIPGLTDLLVNNQARALRRINELNLDFIPGGTEPPNPTQLLSSPAMKTFLETAKDKYDFVILDVPPLIPVADALILSSWVDLNVLVIEPCRVPEKLVRRAIQLLHNHEATIAGVVLNDKSGKCARYYGGYGYYNDKYYSEYYRSAAVQPQLSMWQRFGSKLWRLLNG